MSLGGDDCHYVFSSCLCIVLLGYGVICLSKCLFLMCFWPSTVSEEYSSETVSCGMRQVAPMLFTYWSFLN
jgi:hypothetical protein